MSQNIFDNEIFFTEYVKLRNEKPTISKVIPDLIKQQY